MIERILVFFLLLTPSLYSRTYQLELEKNVWNLVGVNGFHVPSNNTVPVVGWTQLRETADDDGNTTWDKIDQTTNNTVGTPDIGSYTYSTLGIQIDKESNEELDTVVINYNSRVKNRSLSLFTMFVATKGEGNKADLKLKFQSNYEDEIFYITINNSTTNSYEGMFSKKYTRENPLFLKKMKASNSDAIKNIINVFDMNLSDNNLSNLSNLDINNDTVLNSDTGGRQLIENDDNITIYKWQPDTTGNGINGRWNIYSSNNTPSTNDFTEFEAGQAYWIKTDTNKNDPVGLLLGEGDINSTTYQDKVYNGWNLLSFDESTVRHISSGVFIKGEDYNNSGLIIRDSFQSKKIVIPKQISDSEYNVSAYINNTAAIGDLNGSMSWNIRSYPSLDSSGNRGITILSDEKFEINSTVTSYVTQTLGKQTLQLNDTNVSIDGISEKQNFYETRIDEFILGMRINETIFNYTGGLNNHQSKLIINFPSVRSNSYEIDLKTLTTPEDLLSVVETSISGNGQSLLIDQNFSGEYDTLVIGGKSKFYVRDGGAIKIYDYKVTGTSTDISLDWNSGYQGITSNGTLNDLVTQINALGGTSNIYAFVVNEDENRIMLMSSEHKSFQIKEKGNTEQFTIVNLDDEENVSVRGTFSDITSGIELANAELKSFDVEKTGTNWDITASSLKDRTTDVGVPDYATVIKKDLRHTPIWAPDYPVGGPLTELRDLRNTPSKVRSIISGVTREDSTVFWRQADATVSPTEWKNNQESFNLYKLHKKRGYWVYMEQDAGVSSNPLSITQPEYAKTITRTFNNIFTGGNNSISEVDNNQIILAEVDITGFDSEIVDSEAGQLADNVQMNVGGEIIPMLKDGYTTTYIAEINDYLFPEVSEGVYPKSQAGIIITAIDGKGNKREETIYLDNIKPEPPEYHFEDNNSDNGNGYFGGIRVKVEDNVTLQIFDGNLSDYVSNSSKLIRNSENLIIPTGFNELYHHINPLDGSYVSYGTTSKPYYDLRLITYKSNELWSNMRKVNFAPVYKSTHILENNESNESADLYPVAFDSTGQNPAEFSLGGGIWGNSGVELNTTDGDLNIDENITLAMSYQPISGATFDAALADDVFFDDNTSQTGYVGRMRYNQLYRGKVFYIYSYEREQLYYQVFPSGNRSDVNPLELIPIDTNQSFYKPQI
ncbi:MAG: hypothetical protein OIF32_05820 [Campylobacterales bacterium]|nr:hypothetical protein [Campylobacterales bacterium]